jgi:thiol-disulfide isomerase/thioredoxin
MKALCSVLLLACCCLLVDAAEARRQKSPAGSDIVPVSQRAKAPNFSITDVEGKPFTLSAMKGRVVLVDFWAIACGGCKLELPWYVGFDQQYRSKGLSLVGLDMYGEAPEAVKAFAAAHEMQYPVAIGTDAIGYLYHLKEMPLTVLVDRQGRIAVSHAGVVDPNIFESDIKALLAE